MFSFPTGGAIFALAGAVAALAPVVIHLLHRRRFTVVPWAAMDFLREAVRSQRRILQLRDILLLILRSACLLLIGLALARPQFTSTAAAGAGGGPIHAVLLVDNSLSMGYQRLDGALLDEAQQLARSFIDQLPADSWISVIPLCSQPNRFSWDPYRTKDDALAALDAIVVEDRIAAGPATLDAAAEACRRGLELPDKRVVLFSDMQSVNWPSERLTEQLSQIADLQVVPLGADRPENSSIVDFRAQDGVADVETPTEFVAVVRHEGVTTRRDVEVTLSVDGTPVASKTVDLEPGQQREIAFSHRFDVSVESGQVTYVSAAVALPADRLAVDDQRALVIPVVAGLPVVFVDQLGDDEDVARGRFGETYRLRRLLSPGTSRDAARHAIRIRHLRIDELDISQLEDARLVVVAGVHNPAPAARILEEYVAQGGPLLLAAGAEFTPATWNEHAWREGAGFLPAPLKPDLFGKRPSERAASEPPFQLNPASMRNDLFVVEDLSDNDLADLYREPLFFQAVAVDDRPEVFDLAVAAETRRIESRRAALQAATRPVARVVATTTSTSVAEPAAELPRWLLWGNHLADHDAETKPADLAEQRRPQVLARFDNGLPFLVERRYGNGATLFVASAVQSDWNTLTTTSAVLMFDRIMRRLLEKTVPRHDFTAGETIVLPIEAAQRAWQFRAYDAQDQELAVAVEALGQNRYGVVLREATMRGLYRVVGQRDPAETATLDWQFPLAVNGSAHESELKPLSAEELSTRLAGANVRVVGKDSQPSVAPANFAAQNLWAWLAIAVLVGLCGELGILAWTGRRRRATA